MSLTAAQPAFVMLGDSLTQGSFDAGGTGQRLNFLYARRLDVINRGLSGYNTEWALPVAEQVLGKEGGPEVKIATIWFGANDASLPPSDQYVTLDRFRVNLHSISSLLLPSTPLIFITPPPIDALRRAVPSNIDAKTCTRKWDTTKAYRDAVLDVAREQGKPAVDLWQLMVEVIEREGGSVEGASNGGKGEGVWSRLLGDGLHLTTEAYDILTSALLKTIDEHYPNLSPSNVPFVFPEWKKINFKDPRPSLQASTSTKAREEL